MSDSDEEYDPTHVVAPSPSTSQPAPVAPTLWPFARKERGVVADVTREDDSHGEDHAAGVPEPAQKSSEEDGLRLRGAKGRVRCIAVHPAGTVLCAGSEEGQLCMWDFDVAPTTRQLQPTRILTPFVNRIAGLQPIIALHVSLDGAYFVACQDGDSPALVRSGGKQVGYCAMGERGLVDVVQCRGHRGPVTSCAPHTTRAGGFLTAAQDGTARVWDIASFERGSVYAVKHGSGQLTDTVLVESVLGLTQVGSAGQVFVSGGVDGRVQLWDSRLKYRPGGALVTWDVYDHAPQPDLDDAFVEKHVGGIAELSGAVLAVRAVEDVVFFDLRHATHRGPARLPWTMPEPLPAALDTTPVIAVAGTGDASRFLTCTSRAGHRHTVGGHVLEYTVPASASPTCTARWAAGRTDEDVLCVCADTICEGGLVYAGMSSGDVVVSSLRDGLSWRGAPHRMGAAAHPLQRWLDARPAKPTGTGRALGQKASHHTAFDETVGDLF